MSVVRPKPGWEAPQAAWDMAAGKAWFRHGPIDLSLLIEGGADTVREGYSAAWNRFQSILPELSAELPVLRAPAGPAASQLTGSVACRMGAAVAAHCQSAFITPMAAVAGAVADELLNVILDAALSSQGSVSRVAVNNGGDIAVWLAPGKTFSIAMLGVAGADMGRLTIPSEYLPTRLHHGRAGGLATSGWQGRSFSLGVADSVTAIARCAADADASATLLANAVDLPHHPGVQRQPANTLSPDSDLGSRLVTIATPEFTYQERQSALGHGLSCAEVMRAKGAVHSAAMFLGGDVVYSGPMLSWRQAPMNQQVA